MAQIGYKKKVSSEYRRKSSLFVYRTLTGHYTPNGKVGNNRASFLNKALANLIEGTSNKR